MFQQSCLSWIFFGICLFNSIEFAQPNPVNAEKLQTLLTDSQSTDRDKRFQAVMFIYEEEIDTPEIRQALLLALKDTDGEIRLMASSALEKLTGEKHFPETVVAEAKEPTTVFEYIERAHLRRSLGQKEASLQDYTQALAITPDYPEAYFARALAKAEFGDFAEAIADYDYAIALKPQFTYAYYARGVVRYRLRDLQGARADFDEALRQRPTFAQVYYNRGLLSYAQGRYNEALSDLSQAIQLDSRLYLAYYTRGLVYYSLQQFEKAIEDYTLALQKKPDEGEIYYARGICLQMIQKYPTALENYTLSIERNPQFALAYYTRGNLYYQNGKKKRAKKDFQSYLSLTNASTSSQNQALIQEIYELFPELKNESIPQED